MAVNWVYWIFCWMVGCRAKKMVPTRADLMVGWMAVNWVCWMVGLMAVS